MSQRTRWGDVSIWPFGCRDERHTVIRRMLWLGLVIGLTSLVFSDASAQVTDRPPDTMEARLRACAACHGEQGQGTDNDYFPRLTGKPAGYLMNQLVAFRDGRRRYAPMNYLLEYMPDSYLHQMADYFSGLRPPPPLQTIADVSSGILARGQAIVTQGDPGARRARLLGVSRHAGSPEWSPPFLALSGCMRAISVRNWAHSATAPAPLPRPTACKWLPPALPRTR